MNYLADTDLRMYLDEADHPNLFKRLNDAGLLSEAVTKEAVWNAVGFTDRVPRTMTPVWVLNNAESKLSQSLEVSPPAILPGTARTGEALERLKSYTDEEEKLRNTVQETTDVPDAQTRLPVQEERVLTSSRVQINSTSTENAFAEQRLMIPTVAPVLLYCLITLSTMGALMSSGQSSTLAVSIALGMACIVPAVMPAHPVNQLLAGCSAIGWVMVLFWQGFLLGEEGPETLGNFIMEGSVLVPLDLFLLAIGVSVLGDPHTSKHWTRRMANNMYVLAVAMLIFSYAHGEFNPDGLAAVIGGITGLWGTIVLGQSRPIDLRDLPDQVALVTLTLASFSLAHVWTGNIFLFLVVIVAIIGLAVLAPNLTDEDLANWLLLASATGFVIMSYFLTSDFEGTALIHLMVYFTIVAQMEFRYRDVHKNKIVVARVLPPHALRGQRHIQEIDTDFAVLGFKGAGKTSFLGALWLMLDDRVTRDLWFGSAKYLNDGRPLGYTTADIEKLLIETKDGPDVRLFEQLDEKAKIKEYLKHRWAPTTMQTELLAGTMPPTMHGFPFVAQAPRPTRRFLERFTKDLMHVDRMTRRLPDATAEVSGNLNLTVAFNANLIQDYPVWFGFGSKQHTFESMVRNRIHSLDVPGEEVQRAVEHMDGLRISSKSVQGLLRSIEQRPEFGHQKEAIRYIVEMTATFEHVLFIVDADELTSADRSSSSPVGAYLRLADELAHLSGAALQKITVLLNKSDTLLVRGESPNRIMPNGGLRGWEDMLDRELAMDTLREVVGPAILSMMRIPVEVYFTCTFGGLIHRGGDGANQEDFVPTFPMVPVNVLEPVLRSLMRE